MMLHQTLSMGKACRFDAVYIKFEKYDCLTSLDKLTVFFVNPLYFPARFNHCSCNFKTIYL